MKKFLPIIVAIIATIPGVTLRFLGYDPHHVQYPVIMALITAVAIFSASFILTWACEVMQIDIPQAVAVALVALIAVLPEYAVDMYFTWMAGQDPQGKYVHYAVANMTGANRLLIGVGWSVIILIYAFKFRKKVVLESTHKTELFFLMIATLYAITIPLKGTLNLFDTVILFGIFIWYIAIIVRKPVEIEELEGPAQAIAALPKQKRLIVTWGLFIIAALVIFADAELFSESIVATGTQFGINEFLLVQWLAPIASEAPEFIVAITFALRGQAGLALGSLVSSKLNQWTLLVGMIPLVYSISYSTADHTHDTNFIQTVMPLAPMQMHELLLTAAQSAFAIALIAGLVAGKREAFALLILFMAQFLSPFYDKMLPSYIPNATPHDTVLITFSVIYIIFTIILVVMHPKRYVTIVKGYRTGLKK